MPSRVAAIDIGTNTVLLLVAEGTSAAPVAVSERATITRLGAGVASTGRLSEAGLERTIASLSACAAELLALGVRTLDVDVVCTSAARDAENGQELVERAHAVLGKEPRIIAGAEEAHLAFEGALTGLDVSGPVTVFDVGGGSTEIVQGELGPSGGAVASAVSFDVGSVRLTERYCHGDPPSPGDLRAVSESARTALGTLDPFGASTLVGVAGTVTTLAAIHAGLHEYDPARVHGARLSTAAVRTLCERLSALPLVRRVQIPGLEPGRADVIVAGTLIVLEILAHARATEFVASDRGVRWGLARRLLAAL